MERARARASNIRPPVRSAGFRLGRAGQGSFLMIGGGRRYRTTARRGRACEIDQLTSRVKIRVASRAARARQSFKIIAGEFTRGPGRNLPARARPGAPLKTGSHDPQRRRRAHNDTRPPPCVIRFRGRDGRCRRPINWPPRCGRLLAGEPTTIVRPPSWPATLAVAAAITDLRRPGLRKPRPARPFNAAGRRQSSH